MVPPNTRLLVFWKPVPLMVRAVPGLPAVMLMPPWAPRATLSGDWIVAPPADTAGNPLLDAVAPQEGEEEEPTPEAAPAAPSAITTVPRDQDVAPLDAWLSKLIPGNADSIAFADKTVGLTWRITANMFRDLVTLWAVRPRGVEFKGAIAAALEANVWPLLAERLIAPVMEMIFPLTEAWRAHERMEEGEHIGKIVLDVA